LTIELGEISDRDQTFFNGKLIGKTGEWDSPLAQAYDKVRRYQIPKTEIRMNRPNTLVIRFKRYFKETSGIVNGPGQIGTTTELQKNYYSRNYIKLLYLAFYSAVGLYFLFLYIRRRTHPENFYFSTFVLVLVIYTLTHQVFGFKPRNSSQT